MQTDADGRSMGVRERFTRLEHAKVEFSCKEHHTDSLAVRRRFRKPEIVAGNRWGR